MSEEQKDVLPEPKGPDQAAVDASPENAPATLEPEVPVVGQRRGMFGVTDSGESQEVRVKVTLTIPKQPDPIVLTETIPIIDPGETKTVRFQVGALVPFGEQTTVKVDVDPVPGETNTSNNTAEYPVIFTL